jgi:hypothetical protein
MSDTVKPLIFIDDDGDKLELKTNLSFGYPVLTFFLDDEHDLMAVRFDQIQCVSIMEALQRFIVTGKIEKSGDL